MSWPTHVTGVHTILRCARLVLFIPSPQREFDEEIRACARTFRTCPDAAAVSFHHLFCDEEAEAR